ncbi:3,4-dihydroxy-2-butanone-4-phosphate synthase [Vibrio ziniensis]|uniref:3,4-dihydroxy-2-butanone 4-phosphate synthase n=1 Tax=Vibrio ziniensis TaxID=2711221 RepID=A0A6G7CQT7_9VIBR|nr:3,4-dihydroxy-2-butanone-4-phosphate synthase [Vibrio ziniensis]QIH44449.1 3,4-dihydroxy-2-butanone-4-phosphate synthase [Vibrio ziniensis]
MALSKIEDIIEDIRLGKMVILMDDEDRENEGDILIAAEKITPEIINFMVTQGRGLLCLTITEERAKQLNLPVMVRKNTEQFGTNFTVSIEAATGITTGISAQDRAHTIKLATNEDAKASDLVSPGHVFPIIAKPGGVLIRAGHTEAGCDLAKLAGFEPSCAIIEILNPDGTMARRPQLEEFAAEHDIKLGTIADLIKYRLQTESVIESVLEQELTTRQGAFTLTTYKDTINNQLHYALASKNLDINDEQCSPLVRVHALNYPLDLFNVDSNKWNIQDAMEQIQSSPTGGVLVVIGKPLSNDSIIAHLTNDLSKCPTHNASSEIGIGSQILQHLGIHKMRLLTSTEVKYGALSGFDLTIEDSVQKEPK